MEDHNTEENTDDRENIDIDENIDVQQSLTVILMTKNPGERRQPEQHCRDGRKRGLFIGTDIFYFP